MVADGLTKVLSAAKHKLYLKMTGMENQRELLASIRKEKGHAIQQHGADKFNEAFGFGTDVS